MKYLLTLASLILLSIGALMLYLARTPVTPSDGPVPERPAAVKSARKQTEPALLPSRRPALASDPDPNRKSTRSLAESDQVPSPIELAGKVVGIAPTVFRIDLHKGIFAYSSEKSYLSRPTRSVCSAPDGSFAIRAVDPGFYRFDISAEGHADAHFEREIRTSTKNLHFEMERGYVLGGQVNLGFPTSDRRVWVTLDFPPNSPGGWSSDGSFRFESLAAGTYKMDVQGIINQGKARHGKRVGVRRSDRRVTRHLEIPLDRDIEDFRFLLPGECARTIVEVDLPPQALGAYGRYSASQGLLRYEDKIILKRDTEGALCRANVEGSIELENTEPWLSLALDPGTWKVRIDMVGYEPWSRDIVVPSAHPTKVTLAALPGRPLQLSIHSKFVQVAVRRNASEDEWATKASHDARVLSSNSSTFNPPYFWLPPGRYDLRLTCTESIPQIIEDLSIESTAAPYLIPWTPDEGLSISGTFDPESKLSTSPLLYLSKRQAEGWMPLETKAPGICRDGSFRFQGLTPGSYRASIDKAGHLIVAQWELGNTDLIDQQITIVYR